MRCLRAAFQNWLFILIALGVCDPARAVPDVAFAAEAPVVQRILRRAAHAEEGNPSAEMQTFAAHLYCVAARLGSLEGQYRLAKILFDGRGMERDVPSANTLLSIAAGNGHAVAAAMLPQTGVQKETLPRCMESPDKVIEAEPRRRR